MNKLKRPTLLALGLGFFAVCTVAIAVLFFQVLARQRELAGHDLGPLAETGLTLTKWLGVVLAAQLAVLMVFGAALGRQVTVLCRAQTALIGNQGHFRTAADGAPVLLWMEDRDGTTTFANKAIADFRGLDREEAMRRPWDDDIHPDDLALNRAAVSQAVAARRPWQVEYRFRRHDGVYRWLLETGTPHFSADGTYLGNIGSSLDVTAQREAEAALQQSEQDVRRARRQLVDGIEGLNDGFALYDSEDRLVLCNSRFRQLFGLDGKLLEPGTPFVDILRAHVNAGRLPAAIGREEAWIAERVAQHRDPRGLFERLIDGAWYRFSDRPTSEGGIVTIFTPIDDLKQREQRLRDNQAILQSILDHIPVTVGITDRERRIVLLNRRIEQVYGVRFADVAGRNIAEVRPDRYRSDNAADDHIRVMQTGEPIVGRQDDYIGPQGEESWITNVIPIKDEQGAVKYVLRTTVEVPQLAKALRELADNRAFLIEAERQARIASWYQKAGTDVGLVWSENVADILGVPAESLRTDAEVAALIHPDDRDRMVRLFRDLTEHPASYEAEYRIVRPDGTTAWLHGVAKVEVDASGHPHRMIGAMQDVSQQKRVEKALRDSEALLKQAQRRAKLAYWQWDPEVGEYALAPETEDILGVALADLKTDRDFLPYIHDEDRSTVDATYRRQVERLEPYTAEYRWCRPDGKVIWLRDICEQERDAAGRVRRLVGTVQDVTEQKRAEEALRENQALLLAAQRRARIAYWLSAVGSLKPEIATDFMAEVLGLPPGAVPKTDADYLRLIHPEDRPRAAHVYGRAVAGNEPYAIEYRVFRTDGSIGWLRELAEFQAAPAGRSVRMIGTIQDITQQKSVETALRDSEARMRAFMDNAPVAMFVKDLDGRFVMINPHDAEFFDRKPEDLVGLRSVDLLAGNDAAQVEAHDRSVLTSGAPVERELHFTNRPQIEWSYEVKFPIRDANGAVVALGGIALDISDLKRAEQALRGSEARLRRAQQQAKLACWSWELDTDTYFWAPGSGLALGLPDDALPAANAGYSAIVHPADRDALWRLYADVEAGKEAFTAEFRLLRPDGNVIWVEEIGEVERDAGGRRISVSGTLQDVSERKRADAALRDSEARLRGFLDHAPFAMYLKDTDRRYLLVNRAVEQFQGMTAAEICGRTPEQIYPSPLAERFIAEDREVLARGAPVTFEYSDPTLTNYADSLTVRFPVRDSSGRIVAIGGITQDVSERKQAERALRASEARMRSFMDNAPVAVAIKDLERRFVMVNSQIEAAYGRPAHEIVGRRTIELSASEGAASIDALEQEVIATGRTVTAEVAFPNRPALPWTFEVKFPIRDATGAMVAVGGVAVDISARKNAELALAESEARFRSFMDNAPFEMVVKDLDGRYLMVNRGIEESWRLDRAEILGRRLSDVSHSDSVAQVEAIERQVVETGRIVAREVYFRDLGSDWTYEVKFPIRDAAGRIVAIGGVAIDVSDRKRAQIALAESEARLRRAQQQARLAYWSWQFAIESAPEEFRWSPGSGLLLGMNDEDMPTNDVAARKVMHPDDTARIRRLYAEVRSALDHYTVEYRVLRPDGGVVWVREVAEVVRDADGRRVAVEGTLQDITDQRLLEEQLQQSQKMEVVGQLTGGIAHDFNNLLAVILGNLELLREDSTADAEALQKIDAAIRSTLRGSDLIHRLLAFARRQSLAPKLTQIDDLIRSMQALLLRPLGPLIAVEFALAEGLWPTVIDPTQLETSLLNLVINARDAMPDGGTLTIAAANAVVGAAEARQSEGLAPGDYVLLTVGDSGGGMTAEVKARAFDPFFTTKGIGKGTGLGLSMVYGFVKQSGGHIELVSEIGSGATVRLYLPRVQGAAAAAAADPAGRARGGETILIVENDSVALALATEFLAGLGYAVFAAIDGPTALAAVAQHAEIDLLLTDLNLPGRLDGPAVARQAIAIRPRLKVVFMDGDGAGDGIGSVGPGARHIGKPFRKVDLVRVVRDALDERGDP